MKRMTISGFCVVLLGILPISGLLAQPDKISRLEKELDAYATADTHRVQLQLDLGAAWRNTNPNKALEYYGTAEKLAKALDDTPRRAGAMMMRGWFTARRGDLAKGAAVIREASQLYRAAADSAGMIKCMNTEAGLLSMQGNNVDAMRLLQHCAAYYSARRDTSRLLSVLSNLGSCCTYLGKKAEAIQYREQTLTLQEARDDVAGMAVTLMHIGILQDDLYRGLSYYERAEPLLRKQRNENALAHLFNNRAEDYKRIGKTEKAMESYEQAIELGEKLGLKDIVAQVSMNIAGLYRREQKHERALLYLMRAKLFAESHGMRQLAVKCLVNLGYHNNCLGKYADGISFAKEALQYNDEVLDLYTRMCAHEVIYQANAQRGDFENAFRSFQKFKLLSDSLSSQSSRKRIEEFNAKYGAAEKQHAIDLLEKDRVLQAELLLRRELEAQQKEQTLTLLAQDLDLQRLRMGQKDAALRVATDSLNLAHKEQVLQNERLARESLLRWVFIGVSALLLILAGFIVRYLQQRRKQGELRAKAAEYRARSLAAEAAEMQAENERRERKAQELFSRRLIASQEEERSRLAYELHDTLCQDLIVVKNRLLMAIEEPDAREHVLEGVNTITASLEGVRRMSRDLRPFQIDEYGISSALRGMLKRLDENTPLSIQTDIEAIDGVLDKEKEITLFRITQEGVNNILRHAEATEASVRLQRRNGNVQLSIEDNGRGFDPAAVGGGGFGLHGIRQRVKMLGGSMLVASEEGAGTRLELEIPVVTDSIGMAKTEQLGVMHA
ncbi:MAG: hypothetical protein C0600_09980 [Ignavibacteria bacterium]|nr:MAG: hypothetical protein C0600_09980 [Ignavibacteria bacterium]